MAAIRLDVDRAEALAVRLSIAAAIVIVNTCPQCLSKGLLNFVFQPTFAKKCQQRVMTAKRGKAILPTGEAVAASENRR
jgi:hypothetical protein